MTAWLTPGHAAHCPPILFAQTFTSPDVLLPRMGDPFADVPPQPVTFECRDDGCPLEHRTVVNTWQAVEDTVRYYTDQGHLAQARFPNAGDEVWPPEDQHDR